MDVQKAFDHLLFIIETDYRHQDYERVQEVAQWGYSMMTGHEQGEYINVREKETDEEQAQRERLYNSLTPFASRQVAAIYNKVRRTDGVRELVEVKGDKQTQLDEALEGFYAGQHLKEYLHDKMEYYTFYDPNAWIIAERRNQVSQAGVVEAIDIYPLEIPCYQAIDFGVEKGMSQYLVVEQTRNEEIEGIDETLSDFYFYAAGYTLHFHEYKGSAPTIEGYEEISQATEANEVRYFLWRAFETGSESFPGGRVGTYFDPETESRTYWTPLHYAQDVYADLMRDKANHDVNKVLHHYPQKYVYAPLCRYQDQQTGERCTDGYLESSGDTCPQCNGRGALYHVSEQDVVVIGYDSENSEQQLVPLSNFAFYVNLPDWLPKWMAEELTDTIGRIFAAVFATQIDGREAPGPRTATETVLDYEQVYNLLQPYAERYSALFEKLVEVSAAYLEIPTASLQVLHRFPLDFKMATLPELFTMYKTAKDAGVSLDVLQGIEVDILSKQYRNLPNKVNNWKAFKRHLPFQDKTEQMVAFILSARAETDRDRVLYENFSRIQSDIQAGLNVWFHELPYAEQVNLIDAAVQDIISKIQHITGETQPFEVGEIGQ